MSDERGRRQRLGGVAAGVVIVAAVAVAAGTGFSASQALFGDGGGWISKGDSVAHVNTATGGEDATVDQEIVGTAGDQRITTGNGTVTVADAGTGTVTVVDTTTMTAPVQQANPGGAGLPAAVPPYLVAGATGYLIARTSVQPVDPRTLQPAGPPVKVGQVGGAVASAEGTLVVLDSPAGAVVEIDGTGARSPVAVAPGTDARHLALGAAGGRPFLIDTGAGTVRRLDPGAVPGAPARVDPISALTDPDSVAVADAGADGTTAWLLVRRTGHLVGVDLDTGRIRSASTGRSGPDLQHPVVFAGRVYLTDLATGETTVVDATTQDLRPLAHHQAPTGGGRIEVRVQDDHVWINDPDERHALVVDADGVVSRMVDKRDGRGVTDSTDPSGDPGIVPPAAAGVPGSTRSSPRPALPRPPDPAPSTPDQDGPSSGPPPDAARTDVPDVGSLPVDEACRRIRAARLVCDPQSTTQAPTGTAPDTVLAQNPRPGSFPVGTTVVVRFYVPATRTVPGVAGQRVEDGGAVADGPACRAITTAGLTCAARTTGPVMGQPADVVLTQSPATGVGLEPGGTVTITYSPTAVVPALSGTTEVLCAALSQLGLACRVRVVTSALPSGTFIGQDPAPGTEMAAGEYVIVWISRGGG